LILLIEPISKNPGMYVPAFPLPILEIASFINTELPQVELQVVSVPMDFGLPLNKDGKERIYRHLSQEIERLKPQGVGISCTAISQAQEAVHLGNLIKSIDKDIFVFMGGYFPTLYYEEILCSTSSIDVIIRGEGEIPALKVIERLARDTNPVREDIPNLAWEKDGQIHLSPKGNQFDLNKKALLNIDLLRNPIGYGILPYSFSRGCPYRCKFCMEEYMRPHRKAVPIEILQADLTNLLDRITARTLLVSDALFNSFELFPFLRSLGLKINFETRGDVLSPSLIPQIADVCGALAIGLESGSYNTLRRMNKIRNKAHYENYLANTMAIFKEAARNHIPLMVFMIAGYPGDTEADLAESLTFAEALSKHQGPGGHVFKIGECHVYPKTKLYDLAVSLPDTVFDNDGVFGQNIVRQPSKNLDFATVLDYIKKIFNLSNYTPKLREALLDIMPFFRLPVEALQDEIIPDQCFTGQQRAIFNVQNESLSIFRESVPPLSAKYEAFMSGQRSTRTLSI
jgi:radical SAM superfamily enzyme YgiQ (UPF0313 family)